MVETTSEKAVKPAHTKKWLKLRTKKWIDDKSIWMFIDGSSSGWHAAVILDPFAKQKTELAAFQAPKSANIGPELLSCLIGLREVDPTKPLTVVHDYMGTGAWMVGAWKIKSPNVQEAVNQINAVVAERGFTSIRFIHTGGHQKNDTDFGVHNNRADQLCNDQRNVHTMVPWEFGVESTPIAAQPAKAPAAGGELPDALVLTPGQAKAVELLQQGRNVFLTGVAGTGKTLVLNAWLRGGKEKVVAVTASTGIAATHLGGRTVHSWSGCKVGDKPVGEIVNTNAWRNYTAQGIRDAEALVIDEISMLDGRIFEMVDLLCQVARRNRRPFGGLQVILVGDMGQLAPVRAKDYGFVFNTNSWSALKLHCVRLLRVMRQHDEQFIEVLGAIRGGNLSDEGLELLSQRVGAFDPDKVNACRLMTHRAHASSVNEARLAALPGKAKTYLASDASNSPASMELLDKSCLSPKELNLKVGARVMLTKNGIGYVNGSQGTIKRLGRPGAPIIVELDAGKRQISLERATWKISKTSKKGKKEAAKVTEKVLASRVQYPLCLAWAMTIHKSQGLTLDKVSVSLGECFSPGQAYVALSRARSLEGLNIEDWGGRSSIMADPDVIRFINAKSPVKQEG